MAAVHSLLAACLLSPGCSRVGQNYIIRTRSADPLVENGIAFEETQFRVDNVSECVIPEYASVEYSECNDGVFQADVRKELFYVGHPAKSISITEVRQRMGFATRQEGEVLHFATYGEASTSDNMQRVNLTIRIPRSVKHVHRSTEFELPQREMSFSRLKFKASESQSRCEDAETGDEWQVIETHPIDR